MGGEAPRVDINLPNQRKYVYMCVTFTMHSLKFVVNRKGESLVASRLKEEEERKRAVQKQFGGAKSDVILHCSNHSITDFYGWMVWCGLM